MHFFLILALLTQKAGQPGKLIRTLAEPALHLAWTPTGRLLTLTKTKVHEYPTNRTARLPQAPIVFQINKAGTKAADTGFLLDLKTLTTTPLPHQKPPSLKGWFLLGTSPDRTYALATKREPFDGDTTYLLRTIRDQKPKIVATYPDASDDHNWLNQVDPRSAAHPFILHKTNLAGDLTTPYLATPNLKEIKLPLARGTDQVDAYAQWIAPTSPWATVKRRLIQRGADVYTLDLWNYRSRQTIRIAKTTEHPLGPYAIDWAHQQVAYTVTERGTTKVFILQLRPHD